MNTKIACYLGFLWLFILSQEQSLAMRKDFCTVTKYITPKPKKIMPRTNLGIYVENIYYEEPLFSTTYYCCNEDNILPSNKLITSEEDLMIEIDEDLLAQINFHNFY